MIHAYFILIISSAIISQLSSIEVPVSPYGPGDAKFKQLIEFHSSSLAAFADVNSDRRTDVIAKNDDNSISVFLEPDARESNGFIFGMNKKTLPFRVDLLSNSTFPKSIQSITATDFNGDSVVDLMVVTGESDPPYNIFICYGVRNPHYNLGMPKEVGKFAGQPLIADFNGDRIADIYGEIDGKRVVYFGGSEIKQEPVEYTGPTWSKIGYSAFGDFNSDGISDALITVNDNGVMKFQYLSMAMQSVGKAPDFSKAHLIDMPDSVKANPSTSVIGQPRFADFNMDGKIELMLPLCTSIDCKGTSHIYMLDFENLTWVEIPLNLKPVGLDDSWQGVWSFTPVTGSLGLSTSQLVGFSHGDIDLDGYLDLAIVLTYWSTDGSSKINVPAVLLSDSCQKFDSYLLNGFESPDNTIHQIAFFDQNEDGVLDLWMVTESKNFKTARLVQQLQSSNNYFLMVMILNGLCQSPNDCPLAYGLPLPGSSSSYSTYTMTGKLENSIAIQTPLSTFNSLELPYMIFGLNELGNYIENIHANVPDLENPTLSRKIEFTVPDSQLVVNPYPKNSQDNWKVTLYLQPLYNMKVLFIAITLLSLCVVLAIVISVLHCLEKKEDEREKMTEAQGFHFDSM